MLQLQVKSEVLKDIINVLSTLLNEAKMSISPEGMSVRAVDPAHVSMVEMDIKSEAFVVYEATEMSIGLDILKLKNILKLSKSGDLIEIIHDEEHNTLVFKLNNVTRRMALVDTSSMSDTKSPNLDHPAQVVIQTEELVRGIKAAEDVGTFISLTVTPELFQLKSTGDSDSVDLKVPKDSLVELACVDKLESMFSLDYFSKMVKSSSSDSVTLKIGADFPVKIEFDIAEGSGHVTYLLAPRVDKT